MFYRLQQPFKRQRRESRVDSASSKSHHPASHPSTPGGQFSAKMREMSPSPKQAAHDPYEFSDESSSNAGNFRTFRSVSRDDSFSRPFNSKQVWMQFLYMKAVNFYWYQGTIFYFKLPWKILYLSKTWKIKFMLKILFLHAERKVYQHFIFWNKNLGI